MQKCSFKPARPTAEGHAVGATNHQSPVVFITHTEQPYSSSEHQNLIGPNNEDTVEIDGESYTALIDSGSQITSITEYLWKQHPKFQHTKLGHVDVMIEGAGGQTVPYLGVIPVSVTVLGIVYEDVPAFVVPSDHYRKRVPLLIGTNVI